MELTKDGENEWDKNGALHIKEIEKSGSASAVWADVSIMMPIRLSKILK